MKIFSDIGLRIQKAVGLTSSFRRFMHSNLSRKAWTHTILVRLDRDFFSWCFDMPVVGIESEPFVCGIPEIFEYHLKKCRKFKHAVKNGVTVLFNGAANSRLPKSFIGGAGYFQLVKVEEDKGGCWYKDKETKAEGWLCPNLYQFFTTAPPVIHVEIRG